MTQMDPMQVSSFASWPKLIWGEMNDMERWNDSDIWWRWSIGCIYFPIFHVAETVGHAKSSLLSCPWGAHLLESPCLPTSHCRHIWGDLMRQQCNGAMRCSGSLKWPASSWLPGGKMIFLQLTQRCVRSWLCCVSWNILMSWIMSHHEFFQWCDHRTAEDDDANARYARSDPSDLGCNTVSDQLWLM